MGVQTFTEKQLRFTFTLSSNATFAGTNSNVLKISGLRATVSCRGAGLPAFPEAEITVFGINQQDMIALTALAFSAPGQNSPPLQRNTVQVEANGGSGWNTVFIGQIITAGPDYSGAPAVSLRLHALQYGFELLNPTDPTGYTGPTDVVTIISAIAAKMGKVVVNNGVTTQLSNPYFAGTLPDQLRTVCEHAGIECFNDLGSNVIAISPKGVPRVTQTWVLSPSSGLVGYPVIDYNRGFINVRAIFNPQFVFGGTIIIEGSDVKNANGNWSIGTLAHNLDSLMPGGAWFSDMLLYPPGLVPPSS